MAVREDRDVASDGAKPLDDAVSTRTHVRCRLAARAAVAPYRPPWPRLADLRRCQALVVAVLPLAQIVDDVCGIAEPGEPARLRGSLQRTGQHGTELVGAQCGRHRTRSGLATGGEREIGRPGVSA